MDNQIAPRIEREPDRKAYGGRCGALVSEGIAHASLLAAVAPSSTLMLNLRMQA